MILVDHATGTPLAILDGAAITTRRTAAASALATRLLAREDARSHDILGTGVQAMAHAAAIMSARPGIEEVLVWGRRASAAERLAADLAGKLGLRVSIAAASAERAAGCDIVSATTAASEPVLRGAWLAPGAHVNLVGAHSATCARRIPPPSCARACSSTCWTRRHRGWRPAHSGRRGPMVARTGRGRTWRACREPGSLHAAGGRYHDLQVGRRRGAGPLRGLGSRHGPRCRTGAGDLAPSRHSECFFSTPPFMMIGIAAACR